MKPQPPGKKGLRRRGAPRSAGQARTLSLGFCLVWLVDVSMDVDEGSGVIGEIGIGRVLLFR
jgi:hypothetical protein